MQESSNCHCQPRDIKYRTLQGEHLLVSVFMEVFTITRLPLLQPQKFVTEVLVEVVKLSFINRKFWVVGGSSIGAFNYKRHTNA